MPRYEVYANRWNDCHVVEELIPARGLSFSMPLNDHGEASFTATVEPGKSFWRPSVALPMSGILIARDGVPIWQGWVTDERPNGPRTFSFTAREWGYFFETKVPAVPQTWRNVNDHEIFRNLIDAAQAISGQNVQVVLDESTSGAHNSDRTVNSWDDTTVGREFRSVADAEGGPEWYFGCAGTMENPVRQLVLGDRLGQATASAVLEFVEDTPEWDGPQGPPVVTILGDVFPGQKVATPARRRGGNLIAQGRTRSVDVAATVVVATGSGEESARLSATATASTLLGRLWPRMTVTNGYSDVSVQRTLQAHADADLGRSAGIATGYSLVSYDGDPTALWTQTPRGSTVRAVLDTDIYGADRPVGGADGFDARLLETIVRIPDEGTPQVEWRVADVLEVS